jgi:hypothetical protein
LKCELIVANCLPGRLGLLATTSGRSKLTAWMCGYFSTMPANIIPELPPTSTSLCTLSKPWYSDRKSGMKWMELLMNAFLKFLLVVGCDFVQSKYFFPCALVNGSSDFNTASLDAHHVKISEDFFLCYPRGDYI